MYMGSKELSLEDKNLYTIFLKKWFILRIFLGRATYVLHRWFSMHLVFFLRNNLKNLLDVIIIVVYN